VRVEETSSPDDNLVEEAIVTVLAGGTAAIKGDAGEDGEGGLSVVFDHNDIIPSTAIGVPLGAVSESTTVYVYLGTEQKAGGTGPGQFKAVLQPVPVGVTASIENYLTVNVSGVPSADLVTEVKFKIYENTVNPLVDSQGNDLIYTYKLIKSLAGQNAYSMLLTNESQIINVGFDNKIITSTINGYEDALAYTKVRLFDNVSEIPLKGTDLTVKIDGLATVLVHEDAFVKDYKLSAKTLYNYPFVRLSKATNEVYILAWFEDSLLISNTLNVSLTETKTNWALEKMLPM
jgi:hypothetical protein